MHTVDLREVALGAPGPIPLGPVLALPVDAIATNDSQTDAPDGDEARGHGGFGGWVGEVRPPHEWPDGTLFDRFKEVRELATCPGCHRPDVMNADGRVKGHRRVKCRSCGKSGTMASILAAFCLPRRKTLLAPAKSRPPAKVRLAGKKAVAEGRKMATESSDVAEDRWVEERTDEEWVREALPLVGDRVGRYNPMEVALNDLKQQVEDGCAREMAMAEMVGRQEVMLRTMEVKFGEMAHRVETLGAENQALRQQLDSRLGAVEAEVKRVAIMVVKSPGIAVPTPPMQTIRAQLPKAASVVPARDAGAWQMPGKKQPAAKGLSPAGSALLATLATQVQVQAANRFDVLRPQAVEPTVTVRPEPRARMSLEQARNIMRGYKPNDVRPVSTIIGVGKGGTILRPNEPKLVRQMLRDRCDVDLRKVFSVGWIGKATLEVQLDTTYVDTFKALLHNGRIDVDWIVDADPLSSSLFRKGPHSQGGPEAIKEAGKKYGERLRKRMATTVVDCHRRYLREELIRADVQVESGVFVPRREDAPLEGVTREQRGAPMEGVTREQPADPAPVEALGSPQ